MSTWVNFDELRERLQADAVLQYYKIETIHKQNSEQAVGQCPLPNHGDNKSKKTFSVNMVKGLWQCFGCKESGNLLDLACYMEGRDKAIGRDVRQVALKLQEHFFGEPDPKPQKASLSRTPSRPEAAPPRLINPPLDFSLKTLEPKHEFFEKNRIAPDTVEHFGLGFCKRGALTGRIAIPLHDDAGQLIGYAGLALAEPKDDASLYVFPPNREVEGKTHMFDKGAFVYNGHRVKGSVKDLIVVQQCAEVWALSQGGFANVIALMGNECSEDQAAHIGILTTEASRVWLITHRKVAAQHCAESILPKVASSRLCRWIRVPEGEDIAPDHPLLTQLPKQ